MKQYLRKVHRPSQSWLHKMVPKALQNTSGRRYVSTLARTSLKGRLYNKHAAVKHILAAVCYDRGYQRCFSAFCS